MRHTIHILTLVLLLAFSTGAWADTSGIGDVQAPVDGCQASGPCAKACADGCQASPDGGQADALQQVAPFTLPPLPYAAEALQPHINARTMEVHHGKHHAAYVANLNAALEGHPELKGLCLEELLSHLDRVPESIRTAVRNNGGGHANHSLFWRVMSPHGGGAPTGDLGAAIQRDLGGFEAMKQRFSQAAATRFGSGWAWLAVRGGRLEVLSTPNQDTPLMEGARPILGLDVWEHAYYLDYQNRRGDYISAWWNLVDWSRVARNYREATCPHPAVEVR